MPDDEHSLVPMDVLRNDAQRETVQALRTATLAMAGRETKMSNGKGVALNNAGVDPGATADVI